MNSSLGSAIQFAVYLCSNNGGRTRLLVKCVRRFQTKQTGVVVKNCIAVMVDSLMGDWEHRRAGRGLLLLYRIMHNMASCKMDKITCFQEAVKSRGE